MELNQLRNKIDDCDRRIITAFVERMKLAGNIAEYKKENGLPVYDEKREQAVIKKASEMSEGYFENEIALLYKAIMDISKQYQTSLIK